MRTFFYAIVTKQSSEQLCLPLLSVKYQNLVFPRKSHRWDVHQHTELCWGSISCNCRLALHINLKNPFSAQEMSLQCQPAAAAASDQLWLRKWQHTVFQQHLTARTHSLVLLDLGNLLWDRDSNDLERKFGCTEIHGRSLFFFSRARISLLAVARLLFVQNCFPTEECWFGVGGGWFSWNCFCNWSQT